MNCLRIYRKCTWGKIKKKSLVWNSGHSILKFGFRPNKNSPNSGIFCHQHMKFTEHYFQNPLPPPSKMKLKTFNSILSPVVWLASSKCPPKSPCTFKPQPSVFSGSKCLTSHTVNVWTNSTWFGFGEQSRTSIVRLITCQVNKYWTRLPGATVALSAFSFHLNLSHASQFHSGHLVFFFVLEWKIHFTIN